MESHSRPWLGENMYAENKGPSHKPWRPNTEEDLALENFRAKKAQE